MSFKEQIQGRTKKLSVEIIRFCDSLPLSDGYSTISRQLIRCATSVAANYRSVSRAKSSADFINKLNIVEEEADESVFWMEMLEELDNNHKRDLLPLKQEMTEILSIIVASKKTSKKNLNL